MLSVVISFLGITFASAQLTVDEVDICKDPDVKYIQVWLEGGSMNSSSYIATSFGQRMRGGNAETRRLKDKKGYLEVYGIAEMFNILDSNGFEYVTMEISGSGGGSVGFNSMSSMSISTSYVFKRKPKSTQN